MEKVGYYSVDPSPANFSLLTFAPANSSNVISFGAHNWIRTGDLFLTKEVLYLLSYVGNTFYLNLANYGAGDGNRTHAISLEG
jgi:hypothetical protein